MTVSPLPLPHPAAEYIPATDLVVGDVVLIQSVGYRNVLDVWTSLGYVHAVASDATGLWKVGEEVEVGRRPRPAMGDRP